MNDVVPFDLIPISNFLLKIEVTRRIQMRIISYFFLETISILLIKQKMLHFDIKQLKYFKVLTIIIYSLNKPHLYYIL